MKRLKLIICCAAVLCASYAFGASTMTHTWAVIDAAITTFLTMDTAAELEALLSLQKLQGAVTDAQVPNDITINYASAANTATTAATATTATTGDSATSFFASGTMEAARLPEFSGAGVPGIVPDPLATEGYPLLDDGTFGLLSSSVVSVEEISGLTATTVFGAIAELYSLIPEEVPVNRYGYETIPVAWMVDGTSPPAALDTATRPPFRYREFSDTADKDLNAVWFVPSDMDATDTRTWIRAKYIATKTGPTAEQGVAFGFSGVVAGDNDPSNYSKGTIAVITDDALNATQWDVLITGWAAVTISGIEPGGVGEINTLRDVSDAVDDYDQVVGLVGIEIRYVMEAETPEPEE